MIRLRPLDKSIPISFSRPPEITRMAKGLDLYYKSLQGGYIALYAGEPDLDSINEVCREEDALKALDELITRAHEARL